MKGTCIKSPVSYLIAIYPLASSSPFSSSFFSPVKLDYQNPIYKVTMRITPVNANKTRSRVPGNNDDSGYFVLVFITILICLLPTSPISTSCKSTLSYIFLPCPDIQDGTQ